MHNELDPASSQEPAPDSFRVMEVHGAEWAVRHGSVSLLKAVVTTIAWAYDSVLPGWSLTVVVVRCHD